MNNDKLDRLITSIESFISNNDSEMHINYQKAPIGLTSRLSGGPIFEFLLLMFDPEWLPFMVLTREYGWKIKSVSWLRMTWWRKELWYCFFGGNRSLFSIIRVFNNLRFNCGRVTWFFAEYLMRINSTQMLTLFLLRLHKNGSSGISWINLVNFYMLMPFTWRQENSIIT